MVHTISETANPEKTSCKLDGNQSIIQKSSDVTNPITYLTEHNAKTVQNFHQPLITAPQEKSPAFSGEVADPAVRPLEEEESESKERLTQKDSITCDPQTEKHEDKSGVSESNSKTTSEVLQMTETLQHQLAWLNLMPKAKPFQWEESSCFRMPQEIKNSQSDARNDGMLSVSIKGAFHICYTKKTVQSRCNTEVASNYEVAITLNTLTLRLSVRILCI